MVGMMKSKELTRRLVMGAPLILSAASIAPARDLSQLRLIVPFSAGTNTDAMARHLAEAVAPALGDRPVVVNRDGAAGTLAFAELAQRPADDATFLFAAAGPLTVHPHLPREPRIDPADYMPVCQLFEQDLMLVASPRLAVTDVEGLLAAARAAPGTLTIGHYGPASATHLELIGFTRATGINVVAVPYRSHGQLMADLASGALQAAFTTHGSFDPTVIRGLALISDAPNPGVPTTAAVGHRPTARVFGGLIARSGTSSDVAGVVARAFAAAIAEPSFAALTARMGIRPLHAGPEAFARRINEESLRMQALLKTLDLAIR